MLLQLLYVIPFYVGRFDCYIVFAIYVSSNGPFPTPRTKPVKRNLILTPRTDVSRTCIFVFLKFYLANQCGNTINPVRNSFLVVTPRKSW